MNIVVIGASSSVAREFIKINLSAENRFFLISREKEKIEALVSEHANQIYGESYFDFTDFEKVSSAIQEIKNTFAHIDVVLIAHGILPDQSETESNFELTKRNFDINLMSVLNFLIPLSSIMEKQGKGKIGVITSVAGDRGRPRNYTYGSAKGALSLYLQGLRSRLWNTGVEIYDFKLGPVDTPMTAAHEKNFSFSQPDEIARLIQKRFRSKNYVCYLPRFWFWVMLVTRNLPEFLFQRIKFLKD